MTKRRDKRGKANCVLVSLCEPRRTFLITIKGSFNLDFVSCFIVPLILLLLGCVELLPYVIRNIIIGY
jgi:hypothetical protein